MKETRKQREARQKGHAADRAFDPIRKAIDSGELVITPGRRRGNSLWCPIRHGICPYVPDCGDLDCHDSGRA